jgi:hypothetical protein
VAQPLLDMPFYPFKAFGTVAVMKVTNPTSQGFIDSFHHHRKQRGRRKQRHGPTFSQHLREPFEKCGHPIKGSESRRKHKGQVYTLDRLPDFVKSVDPYVLHV